MSYRWTFVKSYEINNKCINTDRNSLTILKSKCAKYMGYPADECTGYFYQNGMTPFNLNNITEQETNCHWCDKTNKNCDCLYCKLEKFCDKKFPDRHRKEPRNSNEIRKLLNSRTIVAIVSDYIDTITFVVCDDDNRSKFVVIYEQRETDKHGNIIF